jgi:signal transduction histidine kinase
VIVNLAANAREGMPEGGRLDLETRNVELDDSLRRLNPDAAPGSHVMLAVTDTGGRVDEATRSRLFEPFFTTKTADRGAGLLLPAVYGIVRQHKGIIVVDDGPGGGRTFRIYFPRIAPTAVATRDQRPAV